MRPSPLCLILCGGLALGAAERAPVPAPDAQPASPPATASLPTDPTSLPAGTLLEGATLAEVPITEDGRSSQPVIIGITGRSDANGILVPYRARIICTTAWSPADSLGGRRILLKPVRIVHVTTSQQVQEADASGIVTDTVDRTAGVVVGARANLADATAPTATPATVIAVIRPTVFVPGHHAVQVALDAPVAFVAPSTPLP